KERASSPPRGLSILMTSAPRSASICDDSGPARTRVRSRILMPESGKSDMNIPPKLAALPAGNTHWHQTKPADTPFFNAEHCVHDMKPCRFGLRERAPFQTNLELGSSPHDARASLVLACRISDRMLRIACCGV